MRRNAWYLIGYLAGWALAEWSLHKLTAPAQLGPDLYGPTSVQPEAHANPDDPDTVPCGWADCSVCARASDAGGDTFELKREPAAAGDDG